MLLSKEDVKRTPLCELLDGQHGLEALFYSRQPVLARLAAVNGATAQSIVNGLIQETTALRGAAPAAGGQAAAAGANVVVGGSRVGSGGGDAIEDALTGAAFARFVSVLNANSPDTAPNRRLIFDAAMVPDCVLTVRILVFGEETLARRHAALSQLLQLRSPYLDEWFTACVTLKRQTNAATGAVTMVTPPFLQDWRYLNIKASGSFLGEFLRLEFGELDWYGAQDGGGLCGFLHKRDQRPYAPPHRLDRWINEKYMKELGPFGQNLFQGLGYPALPAPAAPGSPAGFSFLTWCAFISEHLTYIDKLDTVERQVVWLKEVAEQFNHALVLMGGTVRADIRVATDIRDKELNALMAYDALPAVILRSRITDFEADNVVLARHGRAVGGPQGKPPGEGLPRLSALGKRPAASGPSARKTATLGGDDDALMFDALPEDEFLGGAEVPRRPATTRQAQSYWLKKNELIFVSGLVINVKKLAADHQIGRPDAKCWGVIFSQRPDANRLLECSGPRSAGAHKSLASAAHRLPNLDIEEARRTYGRRPTPQELAAIPAHLRPGQNRRQSFRQPSVA